MVGGSHEPPANGQALRILFSMRNFWYVRVFGPVIRELARRGHAVHIWAELGEGKVVARDWNAAAAAMADEYPNITFDWAPRDKMDFWKPLRISVQLGLDYLRYFRAEYAGAPIFSDRARDRTPPIIVALANLPIMRGPRGRRLLNAVLKAIERAIPFDPDLATYVERHRADVVLLTPLLTLGSEQHDVLRIARRLAMPSVLCVGSWDHLSSKALLRECPDRILVWNSVQKQEALTLHGIPESMVTVTGAQCFDEWFERRPDLDRDTFCRKVGLDPAKPFVLYVCSALFEGSPSEAEFILRWARRLRDSAEPVLRDAGILVRPHPKRGFEWKTVDLSEIANATLWPAMATAPFLGDSKADYFDSMFHAAAVVGLNTSALIEAGIVGRAVHTVLLPEFRDNQEGTLHFHYLLQGDLLRVARDLDAHLAQLAVSVGEADPAVHHNRAFVEHFVRPQGLERPATPVFADTVEAVAAAGTHPKSAPAWAPFVRTLLFPLAWSVKGQFAARIERQRRWQARRRERAALRAAAVASRQARKAARQVERDARVARAREAKLSRKAKPPRKAESRRPQRRHRLVDYYRRLVRPFSVHR